MRVKYFPDTDTALVEFTDNEVAETKEISLRNALRLRRNCVARILEHYGVDGETVAPTQSNFRVPEVRVS